MHCGDAEALAIIDKQVTEFRLTEAARVGQNSLKDGLKVAWRTGDRAEYFGGRRLLLQRLGKVPPHLGELTGARFELLFQLRRWLTWFYPQVCQNQALSGASTFLFCPSMSATASADC